MNRRTQFLIITIMLLGEMGLVGMLVGCSGVVPSPGPTEPLLYVAHSNAEYYVGDYIDSSFYPQYKGAYLDATSHYFREKWAISRFHDLPGNERWPFNVLTRPTL